MENRNSHHQPYRSLFWPIILIVVGTVWLLSNLGIIVPVNIWALWRLWPLLLIAGGLNLIIGRRHALVSAVIGLLTVGAAIALLFFSPQMGLPHLTMDMDVKEERFVENIDGAESAEVLLDLSYAAVDITTHDDSSALVDANLTYTGNINFDASGNSPRRVTLSHEGTPSFFFTTGKTEHWDVSLTENIPMDLNLDIGAGRVVMDLTNLDLNSLVVDGGAGSFQMVMPKEGAYTAKLDVGAGSFRMEIPDSDVNAYVEVDGGAGSFNIDVPENAAVRIEVRSSGAGSVHLMNGLKEVESGNRDEGIWETPGFDSADYKIEIVIKDVGAGSMTVK